MDARIIDRGRGPEIAGSRITVYDVLDYADHRTPEFIADLFKLDVEQILAALRYIDEHRDAVMAEYQEMLDRCARGNPPELQAKLDEGHERFRMLLEIRALDPIRYREVIAAWHQSYERYREVLESHHAALNREDGRVGSPR